MNFVSEKVLPYDNATVVWCPSMDLIGLTFQQENLAEVHRCGYKHQKVFSKELPVRTSAFTFTENGRHCVLGFDDGSLVLVKSDTADEVAQLKTLHMGSPICALWWQSFKK